MIIFIVIVVFATYAMMSIAGELSDLTKKQELDALKGERNHAKIKY